MKGESRPPAQRSRVLVVDDEPPARRRLTRLVERHPGLEWVGEAGTGHGAVAAIAKLEPDVVFLDILMPDLDGLAVLEQVGARRMPIVVFVTAFEEFAVDAFALDALDYLLKPFTDERFAQAADRAITRLHAQRATQLCEHLTDLIATHHPSAVSTAPDIHAAPSAPPKPHRPRRIAVTKGERTWLIPVSNIDWIEAQGAYVRLHIDGDSHLIRESLKSLEQKLDGDQFVRVHRSTIVQIDRVESMAPLFHGESELTLRDGTKLKLSRTYRDRRDQLRQG